MSSVKHILKEQAEEEKEEAEEAEGERRPLVYLDDVGSYSDLDDRRRRRRSIALVLTVICVAVGLSLAVALPLVTPNGPKDEAPVALEASLEQEIDQPVQLGAIRLIDIPETEELETTTEEDLLGSSAPSDSSTSSSSSSSSSSQEVISSDASTPTPTPTPSPSPTLDPFFATCPEVPEHRRGFVDLEFLDGKLLFEVFRIQTEQSPASVDGGISCSVAELDLSSEDGGSNETAADGQHPSQHGTMTLRYLEGRSFFSRTARRVQVNLTEAASSSRDFVESFGHGGQGRLSFLVQLDGLVLTYECFPSYPGDRRPGYVVHVYSLLPPPPPSSRGGGGEAEEQLARALLRLADRWGLNPGRRPVVPVGQRFCNRS